MHRWSMNLFRLFGIQVAVHATFVLLLAYAAVMGWRDGGLLGLEWSPIAIGLLFTCVTLHEFGHSLTAQAFGIRVPRILLLPIGGMAQFEYIPRESHKELLITLAGPAVNFVLAAIFFLIMLKHP